MTHKATTFVPYSTLSKQTQTTARITSANKHLDGREVFFNIMQTLISLPVHWQYRMSGCPLPASPGAPSASNLALGPGPISRALSSP